MQTPYSISNSREDYTRVLSSLCRIGRLPVLIRFCVQELLRVYIAHHYMHKCNHYVIYIRTKINACAIAIIIIILINVCVRKATMILNQIFTPHTFIIIVI